MSYLETLGYHALKEQEELFLNEFFQAAEILPISDVVLEEAVRLRRQRTMSLGDSLVAATALVYRLPLVTRNTDDFIWVSELRLLNPFEEQ